eukprot:scaffold2803_cov76-Cylindrotheca_fusiformis.AAC.2
MSQWMTSGRSRLKARQKNTFAQRAQQRARLVAAATNTASTVVVAHPQQQRRRRQGHPRGLEESINVYQQERVKRQRHANMEILSGEQAKLKYSIYNPIRRRGKVVTARQRILPSDIVRHPGVFPPMETANGGYPPQQQQQHQQEASYRIRPSRPIRNPYAAHYYYASQQRQQQEPPPPPQQQYGDYSHQGVEQPFPPATGTYQDDEHHYDNNHSPSPSSLSGIVYKEQDYHQPQPNGPTYDHYHQHHQEVSHPFPSQEGPRPPFQGRRRPPYLSGSNSWKIPSSSDLEPSSSVSSFGMAALPSPTVLDGYDNAGTGDAGAMTPSAAADMLPMLEPALQSSSSTMNGFMTLDSTSNNWRRDHQYHHDDDDDDPYYYHHELSPPPPATAVFDRGPSLSSVYNVGFDNTPPPPLSTSAIPNSNNGGGGEQNDDTFNNNGYHNNAVLNVPSYWGMGTSTRMDNTINDDITTFPQEQEAGASNDVYRYSPPHPGPTMHTISTRMFSSSSGGIARFQKRQNDSGGGSGEGMDTPSLSLASSSLRLFNNGMEVNQDGESLFGPPPPSSSCTE